MTEEEPKGENSEGAETDEGFTQEIVDAIRAETQSISPKEREEYSQMVEECHAAFLAEFGKYVAEPLSDKEVSERFIITDRKTFMGFDNYIYPDIIEKFPLMNLFLPFLDRFVDTKMYYLRHHQGGFFVIGFLADPFPGMEDLHKRRLIAEAGGDEEKAREDCKKMRATDGIIHEIAHIYGSRHLPDWLSEGFAAWTERHFPKTKSGEKMTKGNTDIRKTQQAIFFQRFIDRYGEDIFRVCLIHNPDVGFLDKLESELTKEDKRERKRIEW